jgi:hypothetical protein
MSTEHLKFIWRHIYFELKTDKLNTLNTIIIIVIYLTASGLSSGGNGYYACT